MTRRLRIDVRLTGGMGDVLLAAPMLEAFAEVAGEATIVLYYHSPDVAAFVFAGARYVAGIRDAAEIDPVRRHGAPAKGGAGSRSTADLLVHTGHFPRFVVRNAGSFRDLAPPELQSLVAANERTIALIPGFVDAHPRLDGQWARLLQRWTPGAKYLDGVGFVTGLPINAATRPPLSLDPESARVRLWTVGGVLASLRTPYVTVHDGFDNRQLPAAGQATKCWPLAHWAELVQRVRTQFPDVAIVQLGAGKSRAIPGVDLNLINATSLAETAWLIKGALAHVDTDSGLAHLAYAVHTPAVVLFGPTNAGYFGHAPSLNVESMACGDCWHASPDWLAKCPRGLAVPVCMTSITPDVVAPAAGVMITERQRAPTFRASPVRCYDGMTDETQSIGIAIALTAGLQSVPITEHAVDGATGVYLHASKQWEYGYACREIGNPAGLKIADVGGGRGALASYLAAHGAFVEQFDRDYIWGNAIGEAGYQRLARELGYRARFGSIYNLPAASASFDVVLCISVLEHLPDKPAALRELLRLVRPGGICVLTFDLALDPDRFRDKLRVEVADPGYLATWLDAAGVETTIGETLTDVEVSTSAFRIHRDGVKGIPEGMTVAGLVLRRDP